MKKILKSVIVSTFALLLATGSALAVANFFNGFEVDTDGWFTDGTNIVRVASGSNGVTSADGDFHAEVDSGAFTHLC